MHRATIRVELNLVLALFMAAHPNKLGNAVSKCGATSFSS